MIKLNLVVFLTALVFAQLCYGREISRNKIDVYSTEKVTALCSSLDHQSISKGTTCITSKGHKFELAMRSEELYEIWQDLNVDGLLWGDALNNIPVPLRDDGTPSPSAMYLNNLWHLTSTLGWYSPSPAHNFSGLNDICEQTEYKKFHGDFDKVQWTLPSVADFDLAESRGIREVLPHMNGPKFWTSDFGENAQYSTRSIFNSSTGDSSKFSHVYSPSENPYQFVRCVGRPAQAANFLSSEKFKTSFVASAIPTAKVMSIPGIFRSSSIK